MTIEANVPNLDAMDKDDLWAFWSRTAAHANRAYARQLFPHKPEGYVRVTKDLGNYAANKATAMSCRLRGQIQAAEMYEQIGDQIYGRLPLWARW